MFVINEHGELKNPHQGREADDNKVYSFKGRTIDPAQSIFVYRNLTKKGTWFSIRQNGVVVAHATALCIRDAEFIVQEKSRQRVLREQQRNVHAFIKGWYATSGMGTTAKRNDLPVNLSYHPYKMDSFTAHNSLKAYRVKSASFCICNHEGVKAAYTVRK